MIAWLNLRYTVERRRLAFTAGLKNIGYKIHYGLHNKPGPNDILVTWNRIGAADSVAKIFEAQGLPVIVTENASWGNEFAGDNWYHLALNYHNVAGQYPVGHSSRWDCLGVQLQAWRTEGETVLLPSRGIGPARHAMPRNWASEFKCRVRKHPGQRVAVPLEQDLATAGKVITWGSGAAIKALMMGIHVESHMPDWIGEQDNTDDGRLAMLRRLAWAQWRLSEIESGEPFKRLIDENINNREGRQVRQLGNQGESVREGHRRTY